MQTPSYVYIMANKRNGTIYIGSTDNLIRRAHEHRNELVDGFTKQHGCKMLVWYEEHPELASARVRERQMKEWQRAWKLREIEGMNPEWEDLFDRIAHP